MHAVIVTGCSRCLRTVPVSHLNFASGLTQKLQLFKCVCVLLYSYIVFHPCSGKCSINIFSISCNKCSHGLFALSCRYCVSYIPQHSLAFSPGQVCGQICHSIDGPKIFLTCLHCQTRERIWLLVLPVYVVAFLHDLTCVFMFE